MLVNHDKDRWTVRLVRGEKLMQSLEKLITENEIPSGSLMGLGAVHNTTLGYYDLANKKYVKKDFPAECELISLVGNISYVDGKAMVHAHVTLSDTEYRAFGGHLFETECAVTVEISLRAGEAHHVRCFDEEIGLNLLELN